ncbi:MAG: hypothetical protein KC476_09185 [Cyanobacteria bacterium HKST-UBA06]|nr:hypothetical protein [Cyanobacteria bacterium HKST-UBA06]
MPAPLAAIPAIPVAAPSQVVAMASMAARIQPTPSVRPTDAVAFGQHHAPSDPGPVSQKSGGGACCFCGATLMGLLVAGLGLLAVGALKLFSGIRHALSGLFGKRSTQTARPNKSATAPPPPPPNAHFSVEQDAPATPTEFLSQKVAADQTIITFHLANTASPVFKHMVMALFNQMPNEVWHQLPKGLNVVVGPRLTGLADSYEHRDPNVKNGVWNYYSEADNTLFIAESFFLTPELHQHMTTPANEREFTVFQAMLSDPSMALTDPVYNSPFLIMDMVARLVMQNQQNGTPPSPEAQV